MLTFLVGAFGFAVGFWVAVWATAAGRADLKRRADEAYARGQHDLMQDTGFAQGLRRRSELVNQIDEMQGRPTVLKVTPRR
jgi:hypothetical protein